MQSTLWSWRVARPDTGFAEPRAAVVSSYSGRWSDVGSDTGKIFGYACRNSDPGACVCLRARVCCFYRFTVFVNQMAPASSLAKNPRYVLYICWELRSPLSLHLSALAPCFSLQSLATLWVDFQILIIMTTHTVCMSYPAQSSASIGKSFLQAALQRVLAASSSRRSRRASR